MKKLLAFLLTIPAYGQLSPISGSLVLPDASNFVGSVVIQLTKPTVTNTCVTPSQVVTFKRVTTSVVNGSLGSLSLYTSACLQPGVVGNASGFALAGAGAGAAAFATGQSFGTVGLTTGTSPAAVSGQVKIGLIVPNLVTCFMQPTNSNAATSGVTLMQTTQARQSPNAVGRYLTLVSGSTPLAATTFYSWSWTCVQPYTVNVYDSANRTAYSAQWVVPSGSADVTQVDLTQIEKVPE